MTQQKTLYLFTALAPRISGAGHEQPHELHEFSRVGAMPNTPQDFIFNANYIWISMVNFIIHYCSYRG